MRILLLGALTACADRDHDGLRGRADCAPRDATVYRGAPDLPQDGIDADCDGSDPEYPWLGTWNLTDLEASYGGTQILLPGTASGTLTLAEDLATDAQLTATLDPAVIGTAFPLELTMAGQASWAPGPAHFDVYAEGPNYGEAMHIDWACALDPADPLRLTCDGELKALEGSLDARAVLVR